MVSSLKYSSPTGRHNTTVLCLPEWTSSISWASDCSKSGCQHSKESWLITIVQDLKIAWTERLYLKTYNNQHFMGLLLYGDNSLHTPSQDGMTPLIVASCKGHSSVVRVLLQAGAVANATSQVRYSSCQMLPQGSFACSAHVHSHTCPPVSNTWYTNIPMSHTHKHMTVHLVWRICPSCCSRRWTWGYCWATAGSKCWS